MEAADSSGTHAASPERLAFINGLRGYAIVGVMFHHFFSRFTPAGAAGFEAGGLFISPFTALANGFLGVNLFFVLSGFVLALPYFEGRRDSGEEGHLCWFYTHRARRLLPLYYLTVLFGMVFVHRITETEAPLRDLFLMATATFNFHPDTWAPDYNWVLWSLGLEVWFSLVFPFLLLAIDRFGIGRVVVAVAVIALVVRYVGHDARFPAEGPANPYLNPIKDSFVGRLDDFMNGVLLCFLCVRGTLASQVQGRGLALFFVGLVLCTVAMLGWDNVALMRLPSTVGPLLHIVLNLGLFAVVLGLYYAPGALRRGLFENRLLQLLGMMCYSIYVWHGVIELQLIGQNPGLGDYGLLALTVFGISAVSYRYVEFGHVKDWRGLFLLRTDAENESAS